MVRLIDEQYADTMAEAGISFLALSFCWPSSSGNSPTRRRAPRPRIFPVEREGWSLPRSCWSGRRFWLWECSEPKLGPAFISLRPRPTPCQVQVQAGQFAFYFRYPGPDGKFGPLHADQINEANANFFGLDQTHDQDSKDDIVTAEMAIPVNREVHLLMHSKDVGHSFFVPELRVQQDFVPGLDLSVHFTATKVGKYEIVCTQLCGLGHYNMKAYLEVMSQEDFDAWLKQQAALQ